MAVRHPRYSDDMANERPNLAPAALVMAQILPVYDEAWDRLRTEYLEVSRFLLLSGTTAHESYTRTVGSDMRQSWLNRLS